MNSALIIRGGAIGDFILTLPALHAFRNHHPTTRLQIMGYPHIADLARERFYAAAVRSIDHRSTAGFFVENGELDRSLTEYLHSFDLIVSYLYDPDEIFLKNLKRAGVKRLIVADGQPTKTAHASVHLARWLAEVGLPARIEPPKLYPSAKDRGEAARLFLQPEKPTVTLHLGSGSRFKNWPVGRFLEIAVWLKKRGIEVFVVDGPADSEARNQFWNDAGSTDCIRGHALPLPVLAAAIQRCAAFVGHDSGISHLAAAVDTPTVAIFGATDPKLWAPRGKSVKVLQKGASSSAVTVEEVKAALEPFLSKTAGGSA